MLLALRREANHYQQMALPLACLVQVTDYEGAVTVARDAEDGNMVDEHRPPRTNKQAFARQLQRAVEQSGLTYEEIARRAREHLPPGTRLSGASIWQYANGKTFPRKMAYIEAISSALDLDVNSLLVEGEQAAETVGSSVEEQESSVRVADLGNGRAKLTIAMEVEWPVALRILSILTSDGGTNAS